MQRDLAYLADIDLEIVWRALRLNLPNLIDLIAPLIPPEDES